MRTILEAKGIVPYFQPIVSARQKTIVGLEALARSPVSPEEIISPGQLFRMAASEGLTTAFERLCCERAVAAFSQLTERQHDLMLFLNLGAWVTADSQTTVDHLGRWLQASSLLPQHVAVEILEAKIDDIERVKRSARLLRDRGFLLVLDDVGAGHSNLDRIPVIKPDILKLDRSLVSHVESDFYKQAAFKSLVGLARKIGALVVAEGIETEDEAIVALELGADFLQGFLLGRPSENGPSLDDTLAAVPGVLEPLAHEFKTYMVRKINHQKLLHRRFALVQDEILEELVDAEPRDFDKILEAAIQRYSAVACLYVLDDEGMQRTETICNAKVPRRPDGLMFHPAAAGADHSLKEYYYILLDVELQKYTTEPYVSLASGNMCQTISTYFRDAHNRLCVLCIDTLCD